MTALNKKIQQVKPSATLKITATAKKMKDEGCNVISFGAGEPDFDTPQYIKDAAIESLQNGDTKYTPASGLEELKKAVADKFKKDNGLDFGVENITISCGAKSSLFNIMQVMLNPGDEVIIFAPYWVTYLEQVKLADGIPIIVDTVKTNFKINFKELEQKISDKTKLIIINSPQNPSGVVYTEEELNRIAEIVLKNKNIYIISDEIYERLIYDGYTHISIAQTSNGRNLMDRIIIVHGVSKTYCMTGWRIGYIAAPVEIAKAVGTLQSHSTSNPTSFCQKATITALNTDTDEVEKMVSQFKRRRDLIYGLLNEIDGIKTNKPSGAFYIFPDISGVLNKSYNGQTITDSISFSEILLNKKQVAVVPGAPFGCNSFIRLCFAESDENIKTGIQRIKEFIEELK